MLFFIPASQAQSAVFDKIIARDGTGDYTSVSTAISMYSNSRKVFFIKNGIYTEKILISAQKTNIRLIGESADGVVITWNDYAGKSPASSTTAESYTFRVEGDGFYAENITFQNTATQAQAVAVYSRADTIAFKNCRFLGYQDTHFADNGRQYFLNCETRGDVDFIFGNAVVVYELSTIVSRSRKPGYITAPSEAVITSPKPGGGTIRHGILFKNSELLSENGLPAGSCYLGRPWGPYSASVFVNCKMDEHIKPEGWSVWSAEPSSDGYNNHNTAFFAEFHSMDLQAHALDISQRVEWSRQLTDQDTAFYNTVNYFKGWDPSLKTSSPGPPDNVMITGDTLRWDEIPGVRGYVILRNDSVTAFSVNNVFNVPDKPDEIYRIKSVNAFGALSEASGMAVATNTTKNNILNRDLILVYVNQGMLNLPENERVEIYDITGKVLKIATRQRTISLAGLKPGILIIRVVPDKHKKYITQKIIYRSLW